MADYNTRRISKVEMKTVHQQLKQYNDIKEYNEYLKQKASQYADYWAFQDEENTQDDDDEFKKLFLEKFPILKSFEKIEAKHKDKEIRELKYINAELFELQKKSKKKSDIIQRITELKNKKDELQAEMTKIDNYNISIKLYNKFEYSFLVNVCQFRHKFENQYSIKCNHLQGIYLYSSTLNIDTCKDKKEYYNYVKNEKLTQDIKKAFLESKQFDKIKKIIFDKQKDEQLTSNLTHITLISHFNYIAEQKEKQKEDNVNEWENNDDDW